MNPIRWDAALTFVAGAIATAILGFTSHPWQSPIMALVTLLATGIVAPPKTNR